MRTPRPSARPSQMGTFPEPGNEAIAESANSPAALRDTVSASGTPDPRSHRVAAPLATPTPQAATSLPQSCAAPPHSAAASSLQLLLHLLSHSMCPQFPFVDTNKKCPERRSSSSTHTSSIRHRPDAYLLTSSCPLPDTNRTPIFWAS
jgi:hypothetical protein